MRTRGILLAVQTALALTLLIGAGLFIRSLRHGLDSDVGFETRSLAMASFDLGLQRYDEPRARELLRAITERAQKFPTVTHVTSAVYPPLARGGSGFFISIDGYTPYEGEELRIEANWVGPSYFEAMGVPLSSGRDIAAGDRDGAPLVAVINETMARRWWAGEDPVGRTFRVGAADAPQVLIVGVARDVKDGLVEDPEPFIHLPLDQHLQRALNQQFVMLVGTAGPADAILPSLRTELRELDRELALQELTTLDNRFAEFLMPQRMGSTLLATLGGLTVLLAIVGISGVVGYAVNQRRRELGIRIALGASPSHILATTIRSALIPIGVGLGVGIVIALATTRLITNFMYTIAPTDVPTFVTIPLLMAVVAAAAAYLPARRAMSVNPTEALRNE